MKKLTHEDKVEKFYSTDQIFEAHRKADFYSSDIGQKTQVTLISGSEKH